MASGSAASSTQKHKKLKATEGEEDTISSKLPEPLICRILSFLSTKDAVCTSVLSKKWINRWTFITTLNLEDSMLSGSRVHFVNFVNRVLLLTQGSSMESISLSISNEYDASLLNTWISGILIRRVKNLDIFASCQLTLSPLTSHLLFSPQDYLEELVLDISSSIKVPPCGFVYFSSLKLLYLYEIIFTFDSSLNLNLPNLKNFETKDSFWFSACEGSVTVDAPLLETILIEHNYDSLFSDSYSRTCTINFTGSQLKEITYIGGDDSDGVSPPIILPAPSSALLFECSKANVQEIKSRAFMLLKQFSQLKSLKFEGLEVLSQPNILPVFPMLCHLKLDFVTCRVLLGLLQRSPFLMTLAVNKVIYKQDKELLNLCVVPECLIYTLQIVKFKGVDVFWHKNEHELYLAKLLLENCMVLERMTFPKEIKKLKEKLLSFKKGCSSAIIEFLE